VPGTPEGVPAVEQLLAEGININITLLFSQRQYEAVARAYLRGVARAAQPAQLASVASVFVSRIDTAVDRILDASADPAAKALRGKVGLANCRGIYAQFQQIMQGPEFAAAAARGARPQRVLWASTSTKDPSYRDTLYVEELVAPETVDTIPPATLAAFEDHGVVRAGALVAGIGAAPGVLGPLPALGVDLDRVTDDLQVEGLEAFATSYANLLRSIEAKKEAIIGGALDPQVWKVGADEPRIASRLAEWEASRVPERFWKLDATLWPAAPPKNVAERLGWLRLPEGMHEQLPSLVAFAESIRNEGTRHVVVLGMGGSSLAPDVFRGIFGSRAGFPELIVLDSTHPAAVADVRRRIDLRHTFFVVSSKSGTTT
ncbi:MAG: hypothetical protein L3J81_06080, partial [Thermoplasmata archaeon]|nr:hypothetical protein [Thermoplasmata archaeon]